MPECPEGDPQDALDTALQRLSAKLSESPGASTPVRLHIPDTDEVLKSVGQLPQTNTTDQSNSKGGEMPNPEIMAADTVIVATRWIICGSCKGSIGRLVETRCPHCDRAWRFIVIFQHCTTEQLKLLSERLRVLFEACEYVGSIDIRAWMISGDFVLNALPVSETAGVSD